MSKYIKLSQEEELDSQPEQTSQITSPETILNSPQITNMLDQIAGSIVKENQAAFADGVSPADIANLETMISKLVNLALPS